MTKFFYKYSKTIIKKNRFQLEKWIKTKFEFENKKNYLSLHIEKDSIGIYIIQYNPASSSNMVAFENNLDITEENVKSEIIRLLVDSSGKDHLKFVTDRIFINSLEDFCFKQFVKKASKNNNLRNKS